MKTKINDRVRQIREAANRSQTDFAAELGASVSLISKIEAGQKEVSPKISDKIVEVYSVPSEWLLKGQGDFKFKRPEKGKSSDPWKEEAWTLAKSEIEEKNKTINSLAVSFDRLTSILSKLEVNFLHPVKETA